MGKRVAVYVRVSTELQTTENQEVVLSRVAATAGWEIVESIGIRAFQGPAAARTARRSTGCSGMPPAGASIRLSAGPWIGSGAA
jgi:hypothetical protein